MKNAQLNAQVAVLKAIEGGLTTINSLAKHFKRHRSTINRTVNDLEKQGLIKKIGYPFILNLTGKGKIKLLHKKRGCAPTLTMRESRKTTRMHGFSFKFPILRDDSALNWDKVTQHFRNSVKKYKRVEFPVEVTLEKTSKSVILHLHEKEVERRLFFSEVMGWALRIIFYAHHYLKKKGLVFDMQDLKLLKGHLANPSPEFEGSVDKRLTHSVDLGRKAHFLVEGGQPARAWLDRSLGLLEAETNDMKYEEKLLLQPERIELIMKRQLLYENNLELYNEQIEKHLAAVNQMSQAMKDIRNLAKKTFKKK